MHARTQLTAAALRMAEEQDNLVTRQQLLAAGMSAKAVAGLVAKGWLKPMGRGVYLIGATPPPWCRERAVLLRCPTAVLSHWSAARLDGMVPDGGTAASRGTAAKPADADVVWIIVPKASSGRAPGVRALRTDHLHATEWRHVRGLAATTPARTLLDLAVPIGRAGEARRLERLVAASLDEKRCTAEELFAVLARHAHSRGAGLLRLVLGDDGRPALTRSEAEERLRQHLLDAEVAPWQHNVRVAGYEVDFLWPKEKLVVEVDGVAWHSSRHRFQADRDRDNALHAAGYTVLRFTWQRIDRKPMAVVARIAHMLGRLGAGR